MKTIVVWKWRNAILNTEITKLKRKLTNSTPDVPEKDPSQNKHLSFVFPLFISEWISISFIELSHGGLHSRRNTMNSGQY